MTDHDLEKIRVVMREVIAPLGADVAEIKTVQAEHTHRIDEIKAVQAEQTHRIDEIKAVQAEHTRDIALLRQDVTKIRNVQMGQEVKLDDVQDYFSRIAEGVERLRPPAVPPLGEGRVTEIRQMHSQINAVERKMAEFQARIEVLEGSRIR